MLIGKPSEPAKLQHGFPQPNMPYSSHVLIPIRLATASTSINSCKFVPTLDPRVTASNISLSQAGNVSSPDLCCQQLTML
jgi:hypothetical protein